MIHDQAATDEGYRALASAVIRQALEDIQGRGPIPWTDAEDDDPSAEQERRQRDAATARRRANREAVAFLFDPSSARIRGFWLAWLGTTEAEFWNTLAKAECRGERNRLLPHVQIHLERLGVL